MNFLRHLFGKKSEQPSPKQSARSDTLPTQLEAILRELSQPARRTDMPRRVQLCEQALAMLDRAANLQLLAMLQVELGNSLAQNLLGARAENQERAIQLYEQALQVRTRQAMPVEWAQTTSSLANAYYFRIRGERAENIERAIELYEQALQVRTRQVIPIEWAQISSNLATGYADRIRGERAENIERAIELYEQALQVMTRHAMPVEWAGTTMNLATAYNFRIRGERAENIERAVQLNEQALQVITRQAMPIEWAETTMNLATAYTDRIRGERAENLERAIAAYEQVLQVVTRQAMPVEWATTINNLAIAYADRIRGERAENIERAIQLNEQALQVRTHEAMPIEWATTTINLATAYADRIRGERAENIERAIELYEQALQVITRQAMPVEWATTTSNLALAYGDRTRGERAENIERAIQLNKQALQVRTRQATPVEWATTTVILAIAYRNRIRGERAENLERAIQLNEQALQIMTRQTMPVEWATTTSNLAIAYYFRIRGERTENLERAIQLSEQALQVYTQAAFPDDHRLVQQRLGDLYFGQARWPAAAEAFEQALMASELLYAVAATPEARQAELRKVRGIPAQRAYAMAKASDATPAAWHAAVLVLEQNRARWLNESLALNAEKPVSVPDAIWQSFVAGRTQVQQLQAESQLPDNTPAKRDYLTLSAALATARTRLNEAAGQVRAYTDNFMPEPTFAQVQAVVQAAPLVYLLTTTAGGLALIVQVDKITPVWLDGFTKKKLWELFNNCFRAYSRRHTDFQSWCDTIDRVTRRLWDNVMGPLAVALHALASPGAPVEQRAADEAMPVTLIPTDLLNLLPLHAAWTSSEGEGQSAGLRHYFLDEFVVNYAPSARALTHATTTAQQVIGTHLLAVDEPRPVRGNALPNSAAEVAAIADLFVDPQRFQYAAATRSAILAALPQAQVAHFSCHGEMNWRNALESALFMAHDEPLTVRDLLESRLAGARLATLSACETGIVDMKLPDEVVALPSALVQAGFAGVVASLWSVSEISTALLMSSFYVYWKKDGFEPAQALRAAQQWMYTTTNRQKREYFALMMAGRSDKKIPVSVARQFFYTIEKLDKQGIDLRHPLYWAAFYLTGV